MKYVSSSNTDGGFKCPSPNATGPNISTQTPTVEQKLTEASEP